jgi:hypothetical protein
MFINKCVKGSRPLSLEPETIVLVLLEDPDTQGPTGLDPHQRLSPAPGGYASVFSARKLALFGAAWY